MMRWPVIIALGFAVSAVRADSATTRIGATEQRQIGYTESLHKHDEIARAWDLTTQESIRFAQLMRGPRGAFSVSNISPLEVLGIHAETPTERRAYADRLVNLLYEDTERVLAFERETQAAWKRLGHPMFDPALRPGHTAKLAVDSGQLWGKRLALLVALENCPRCKATTRELVRTTGDGRPLNGLDIYVVDTTDGDAIRDFARDAGIVPEAVSSRRITLNQGAALFAQYLGDDRDLPKVFVRDGGQLRPLTDLPVVAR